eukprot:m.375486 g.375486  ORF g.375486 m.375486 type:complete len:141 (+) comp56177_c1_seq3:191-613(+)
MAASDPPAPFTDDDVERLMKAVRENDLPECQRIVQRCTPAIITTPKNHSWGRSALREAAQLGRDEILGWFLKQRPPNIDVRDSDGDTALIRASDHGYTKCVELLIGAGADVQAVDKVMLRVRSVQSLRFTSVGCRTDGQR